MKISKITETGNNTIYIDEGAISREMIKAQSMAALLQSYVNQWHEATETDLETEDLPIVINGTTDEIKELVFNKLAGAGNDTLFGIKINKGKALEILNMPDVSPIFADRKESKFKIIGSQITNIDVSDFYIETEVVKIAADYETRVRAKHTITAETAHEIARRVGFRQIILALQTMKAAGALEGYSKQHFLGYLIEMTHIAINVNHNYIKTGHDNFDTKIRV